MKILRFNELYSNMETFLFADDGDIERVKDESGWSGYKMVSWDGRNNIEWEFENFHELEVKEKISDTPYQFLDTYICVDEFGDECELIASRHSGSLGELHNKEDYDA